MKYLYFFATSLLILGVMAAPAFGQQYDKTFTGFQGSIWNAQGNWSPVGIPDLDDTVLIPSGLTCKIFDHINGGLAQSVDVQVGATLGVDRNPAGSAFLNVRATAAVPTTLTVDGTLRLTGRFADDRAKVILGRLGANSGQPVAVSGAGVITAASATGGGPAQFEFTTAARTALIGLTSPST